MVLTAYSVISLAIGLSCHHRRRECRSIVADLISASRYQDHTALPSAPVRFVSRIAASIASRAQRP
jgi:hypothetical protein